MVITNIMKSDPNTIRFSFQDEDGGGFDIDAPKSEAFSWMRDTIGSMKFNDVKGSEVDDYDIDRLRETVKVSDVKGKLEEESRDAEKVMEKPEFVSMVDTVAGWCYLPGKDAKGNDIEWRDLPDEERGKWELWGPQFKYSVHGDRFMQSIKQAHSKHDINHILVDKVDALNRIIADMAGGEVIRA